MFSSRWFVGFCGLALMGWGFWVVWDRRQEAEALRRAGGIRLALLPCEFQSSDQSLSPFAASLPRILTLQMEAVPQVRLLSAGTPADALAAGATHLLHCQVSGETGGQPNRAGGPAWTFRLEGLRHREIRVQSEVTVEPSNWSVTLRTGAAVLTKLLQADPSKLTAPPSGPALRALMEGFAAPTAETSLKSFEDAVAQDPLCGWCWVAWAETATRLNGPPAGRAVLERFQAAKAAVDGGSAARLALLDANFSGDDGRKVAALWKLAELRPNDTASLTSLAQLATELRQYSQAEKALRRLVEVEPGNADQWNTLAYVQAYQGRTEEALKSVTEYERLAPASPNPLDSRGEILFMAGRFSEAESAFLACARKDPDFNSGVALEKAALARMLGGDVSGAAAILERYLQERREKKDVLAGFHRARWDWLMGKRGAALERMQAIAESDTAAASLAAGRMTVWALESGDQAAAREWAQRSLRQAKRPGDQLVAVMALSLAGFADKVKGLPPPSVQELNALRLTLLGEFSQAGQAWLQMSNRSGASSGLQQAVGAWALLRAGRQEEARRAAAAPWPVLTTDQLLLFDSLVYQSALYTRAELARESKRDSESQRLFDLYLRSMGDAKDRFGQMARARGEARL